MKRTTLKSKDVMKKLSFYDLVLSKKDRVELIEDIFKIFVINGENAFFYHKDTILPTLHYLQKHTTLLKTVTVDMGAIKFVINGADIMRPGIVSIDEGIKKGDFVVIVDENNRKPLSICRALMPTQEMSEATSGKVLKNIHFVGDELWKINVSTR